MKGAKGCCQQAAGFLFFIIYLFCCGEAKQSAPVLIPSEVVIDGNSGFEVLLSRFRATVSVPASHHDINEAKVGAFRQIKF